MSSEPRGLVTSALEAWLRAEHPELVSERALEASLITGGRSNLTYRLVGGPAPALCSCRYSNTPPARRQSGGWARREKGAGLMPRAFSSILNYRS